MKTTRWAAWALVAATSGCGNGVPQPQPVVDRVELKAFSGPNACADLEQYIEDTAVLDMRTQMEAMKEGRGGWWAMGRGGPAAEDMAATAGAPSSGPSAYTTTNTQVAGVDEADFVKNDGTRIFTLSGDTLYTMRSWPASQLALAGKLKLEGWPQEMFLDETNRLVVFSAVYERLPFDTSGDADLGCSSMRCGYYYSNTVKLTVVDVSDLQHPKVAQQFYLPGSYSNSRRVGSSVRVVLSDHFRYPPEVRWHPDYSQGLWEDKAKLARAYDQLINANEKLIRAQDLKGWLPPARATLADGSTVELPYDCGEFHRPTAPTRLGMLSIATLNLAQPQNLHRTTVLAETGQVYSSKSSLYVANTHWWWWAQPGQVDTTYLHKFDIQDPNQAVYVASGRVDGHIVDQFSMDEDEKGFFRVATTIGTRVSDPLNMWGRVETVNRLSVMAESGGALKVIGRSEDLAKGERIFSARFTGDKGYVVTFRNIDPLFTFDLSDPAKPRQVGELKVPGFSSYIHPIDANHLLTIGTYIPENNNDWRARALQLSLFDVSDLSNPVQKFTQHVGTASAWSEAQYEHKAFNYFAARKLLAIPFYDWNYSGSSRTGYWNSFVSDLRVFEVDPAQGFKPKGALSMKDMYVRYDDYRWTWYWTPMVRRSIMADQFVYAISDSGVRVADVADLSSPLATVAFSRADDR